MLLFSLLISPAQSLHRLLFTEKLFHISEFPPQLYIPVTEQSSLFAKKINSRQSLQKPQKTQKVFETFLTDVKVKTILSAVKDFECLTA